MILAGNFVKAGRVDYFQIERAAIKNPGRKRGRNLPGKGRKMYKQNANPFLQTSCIPICLTLSFVFYYANSVPESISDNYHAEIPLYYFLKYFSISFCPLLL
jgi:hypothetical protein